MLGCSVYHLALSPGLLPFPSLLYRRPMDIASSPGLLRGGPGTHCMRMRQYSRGYSVKNVRKSRRPRTRKRLWNEYTESHAFHTPSARSGKYSYFTLAIERGRCPLDRHSLLKTRLCLISPSNAGKSVTFLVQISHQSSGCLRQAQNVQTALAPAAEAYLWPSSKIEVDRP